MAKSNKYTKVGKGVAKNQPEKRAIFRFFDIYFGQFWNLIKTDIILFAVFVPLFFAIQFPFSTVFVIALLGLQILLLGPGICGATYVFRNIVSRSHVWVWSDFKDIFIDNYKYGFLMGLIDAFLGWGMWVAYAYYSINPEIQGQVMSALVIVSAALFFMINIYIYPMIITFDNKFSEHFKNAIVFALANLPRSVLALFINIAVIGGIGYLMYAVIPLKFIYFAILAVALLIFSLIGFINMFIVWPVLKPYIDVQKKDDIKETETLFSDEPIRKENNEESK